MQVSTIHNDTLVTGVVLKSTPFFIEVAITSPFSKLFMSRNLPACFRKHSERKGKQLESEYLSLLVELYEVANSSLNKQ